jgi:hypothetical protein
MELWWDGLADIFGSFANPDIFPEGVAWVKTSADCDVAKLSGCHAKMERRTQRELGLHLDPRISTEGFRDR